MQVCDKRRDIPAEIRRLSDYGVDDACFRLAKGELIYKVEDIPSCVYTYADVVSHLRNNSGSQTVTTTSSSPVAFAGSATTTTTL